MQVICLEEPAFYALLEQSITHLQKVFTKDKDRWLTGEEAMRLLNIKSKTTMQKLRDEGRIRYSQPDKRIIMYDRESINEYLENNAKDTF